LSYPAPRPGLVIRYRFLWSREAKAAATEGRKDRPCAIVVAVPRDQHGDIRVVVVPVSYKAPHDDDAGIELSAVVKEALGLDAEACSVVLDEMNVFSWPGYDLRPIAGTDRVDYGVLPQQMFEQTRRGVVELDRARKLRRVGRD